MKTIKTPYLQILKLNSFVSMSSLTLLIISILSTAFIFNNTRNIQKSDSVVLASSTGIKGFELVDIDNSSIGVKLELEKYPTGNYHLTYSGEPGEYNLVITYNSNSESNKSPEIQKIKIDRGLTTIYIPEDVESIRVLKIE